MDTLNLTKKEIIELREFLILLKDLYKNKNRIYTISDIYSGKYDSCIDAFIKKAKKLK